MTSFQDLARRAYLGPKVRLSISTDDQEVYIRAKKLPSEIQDRIDAIRRAYIRENKEVIRGYAELEKRLEAEGKTLDDADAADLANMADFSSAPEARAEIYRLLLLHGIGEHNIPGDDGKIPHEGRALDKALVEQILDWDPIATEICAIPDSFNRPLAKGSKATSETSRNGSTAEPSTQKTPSSPTQKEIPAGESPQT